MISTAFTILILSALVFLLLKKYNFKKYKFEASRDVYFDSIEDKHSIEYIKQYVTNNNLESCYLIHGTFVGDDPLLLFQLLDKLNLPFINSLTKKFRKVILSGGERINKDIGNFTSFHKKILNQILPTQLFHWDSGNNHNSRVKASFKLLKNLSNSNEKSILIISHSHGGQVCALLTQLIYSTEFRKKIQYLYPGFNYEKDEIKKLRKMNITFITLGMPPRYKFVINNKIKLIQVINHRRSDYFSGKLNGIINTKDGDYIQKIGVEGSDFTTKNILNQKLDNILDRGQDLEKLKKNINRKYRFDAQGKILLIDLKDNSSYPNFLLTLFGHGSYTKKEIFLPLLEKAFKYLS